MRKSFNTSGVCFPDIHYMVNVDSRTEQLIQGLILQHKYFTINCARQYGKTTILDALYQKLKLEYSIFFLNFEDMGSVAFSDEYQFCKAFLHLMKAQIAYGMTQGISEITVTQMERDMERENFGQAFNRVWGCRSQKGHYCGSPICLLRIEPKYCVILQDPFLKYGTPMALALPYPARKPLYLQ